MLRCAEVRQNWVRNRYLPPAGALDVRAVLSVRPVPKPAGRLPSVQELSSKAVFCQPGGLKAPLWNHLVKRPVKARGSLTTRPLMMEKSISLSGEMKERHTSVHIKMT
jgi:hypothetical protein